MADNKKYYWLKLKRDFFKRHDIRIVESMPNGKDYILFYLKLLLESIDHEGTLRFSETIPYNEHMLSVVTNTNIDTVKSAMKLFIELNMMTVFDDQTIYMTEVDKLIGSESSSAERVRKHRALKGESLHCNTLVTKGNTEIEKEIHKDTYKEVEVEVATATAAEDQLKLVGGSLGKGVVYLTDRQLGDLMDRLGLDAFNRYVDRLATFIIEKKAHVNNHYETIIKWYTEDSQVDKSGKGKKTRYGDFNPTDAMNKALERSYRKDAQEV